MAYPPLMKRTFRKALSLYQRRYQRINEIAVNSTPGIVAKGKEM